MRHAIGLSFLLACFSSDLVVGESAPPEWDGQKVFVMEEDPAHLTPDGYRFFRPRQERSYLVR